MVTDRSLNPITLRRQEIKRRTVDIGIFPNTAVLLRLMRMLLEEQDEDPGIADQNKAVDKLRFT